MDMPSVHQVWPKPYCKTQWQREEDKEPKELGRQHEGMDRPGDRQVSGGSGEERKEEESGREVIRGAPTTPAVKG